MVSNCLLTMGLLRAAVKPWLSMGFIVQKGRWGPGRSQLGSQAPRNDAGSALDSLSYKETIEERNRLLCQGRGRPGQLRKADMCLGAPPTLLFLLLPSLFPPLLSPGLAKRAWNFLEGFLGRLGNGAPSHEAVKGGHKTSAFRFLLHVYMVEADDTL